LNVELPSKMISLAYFSLKWVEKGLSHPCHKAQYFELFASGRALNLLAVLAYIVLVDSKNRRSGQNENSYIWPLNVEA
jgi:hypothetical protein